MVDVRLPDGRVASFPDEMPREQIKAIIQFKFPEQTGSQPVTADTLMGLAQQQFGGNDKPQAGQYVEGNPTASVLPGPLGQFQNTMSAFGAGMGDGLTGNFSSELFAGALTVPEAIASGVSGNGFDLGKTYGDVYNRVNERRLNQQALNPSASDAGHVTGSVVLGGKLAPVNKATSGLGLLARGVAEGGIYGGIYGYGGAEGSAANRAMVALQDAGYGALGGGVVGGAAAKFGGARMADDGSALLTPVSPEARILSRGLQADGIEPSTLAARVRALDPNAAMIADLGPNMQAQAAAIATTPGPGSKTVIDALTARRTGANERIRSNVETALGVAPRPSQVASEISQAKDALDPIYGSVLRAKAASASPLVDTAPVIKSINDVASSYVGGTRRSIERARDLIIDAATGAPIGDPALLLAARHELDGIIGDTTNTTTKGALVEVRRLIDDSLAANVPGIKQVDAQFQDLSRQQESFDRGKTILRDGVTQASPDDLAEEIAAMFVPSGVNVGPTIKNAERLQQGLIADIDRIIGQSSNDRVKLRDIIRGEGSWNYDSIATVLGPDRADDLMRILNKESVMAGTENLATAGSRTQVLKAAQDEFGPQNDPSVIREALNFQYGNAAGRAVDKLLGGVISAQRQRVTSKAADALVSQGLSSNMQDQLTRIAQGLTPRQRAVMSALLAGQAAY